MIKRVYSSALSVLLVGTTVPAVAATPKDEQALKKVDEALKEQYPAGKYDAAERTLRSAVDICGKRSCSKEVLGKAHVAIGVVRSKADQNLGGARKAFEQARKVDPNANLDPKLVSPPVAKNVVVEFYKIMGREIPSEHAKNAGPNGNLHCAPDSNYTIQTAQPIAVACDPKEGAVRAELHYRMSSEDEYSVLLMAVQDGTFRANIPCEPLAKPGRLDVYVVAQDVNKEKVDSFGTADAPAHYEIVSSTDAPVPSYPGQDPPKRCSELLVSGGALGESCGAMRGCKRGLYCGEGLCQRAQACETDSECESEQCNDGFCSMEELEQRSSAKPSKWLFGLHGGLDLWIAASQKGVCSDSSQRAGDYFCYNRDEERIYDDTSAKSNRLPMTDPNSGNVAPGFRAATIRVLASIDYALTEHWSVGARLGWAFAGGPRALEFDTAGRPSRHGRFIPVHVEARGTYWLTPPGKPGFHPYAHASAGMADVDVNTPINAKLAGVTRRLDAWRRMGPAFAGAGLGVLYNVTPRYGIQLNLDAMFMFPSTGFVLEPSLGGVVGF